MIKSGRQIGAAFILLLVGVGCIQVQTRQNIGLPTYPATDPGMVQVLRTAPTRPNIRIGEITVEPNSGASVVAIEKKFQQAAAKIGANAVVIVSDRNQVMGMIMTGPWYGSEVSPEMARVIVGVAIRYTDDPNNVRAPGAGGDGQTAAATAIDSRFDLR
jgi:hypothetical protein